MVTFPIAQVEVLEEVLEVQVFTDLQEVSLHPQVTDPVVVHPSVTALVVAPHTDPEEVHLLVTDQEEALFSDPVEVQAITLQEITDLL